MIEQCLVVSTEDFNRGLEVMVNAQTVSGVVAGVIGASLYMLVEGTFWKVRRWIGKTPEESAEPSAGGVADGPRHDKP
mgnify:CR=1 FL=1